ncbi:DMT family transporter [Cellulomonas sp. SG140]|uniref:DMT family transporter n=1 Tax=Cellulomonas sp. SG140 TaxID=2976536 RepID=UPI0021E75557|nr:DMT family transporter [Cellulomonas sp. SG140]
MLTTRSRSAVDAVLLGVALVWGSSYLVAKELTAVAPVVVVLALRYVISAVALAAVGMARRMPLPRGAELCTGMLLGCTQAAVLTLETFGVAATSATNAGLIISLTIVVTPVLESLWSRAWLPVPFFVAAVLAVLGVALLVSGRGFRAPTLGDLLMLAAAAVRAVHVSLIGRLTRGRQHSSLSLTTAQAVVGAVLLSAIAGGRLASTVPHLSLLGWSRLAYLALACSVFAFLAQTWAIRRTSASRASLLLGTEPLWAVAVGVSLGGEPSTALGVVGAALIVASTTWGQQVERRHRLAVGAPAPQLVIAGEG